MSQEEHAAPGDEMRVMIRADVEFCRRFQNARRIVGYVVIDAAPHVTRFVTGSNFLPDEAAEILADLVSYGYQVEVLPERKEVSMLEWITTDEPERLDEQGNNRSISREEN